MKGKILRISGPLVVADIKTSMYEIVRVGEENLIGEVIKIDGNKAYIQVYEDTVGLKIGEPVEGTGKPLSVELGPGLLGSIYDGLQRPLSEVYNIDKNVFIKRGVMVPSLNRSKKWEFVKQAKSEVKVGEIIGYVQETPSLKHYIISPYSGKLELQEGKFTVEDIIGYIDNKPIKLYSTWPVRIPRPV